MSLFSDILPGPYPGLHSWWCVDCAAPGVNIRILTKVFELCKTRSATHEFSITLSMLEIYNEEVRLTASPSV